jgi:hypothetical protein
MKLGTLVRTMRNDAGIYPVYRWIMLTNGWEFYQTEPEDCHNVAYGYVLGLEDEWGSVSLDEYAPHVMISCSGNQLAEIDPPPGFEWGEFDIAD